jgi:hypothetical protein
MGSARVGDGCPRPLRSGHLESGMDAKAFPPALAESMDVAFKRVCKSLGAKPGHEIATRAAAKIVELVKAGVSDPDKLYSAVLNDLKKR